MEPGLHLGRAHAPPAQRTCRRAEQLAPLQHLAYADVWPRVCAQGCIKACVLIENITASFQMDEILHELREHSAGLNCGIWDYSASFVAR